MNEEKVLILYHKEDNDGVFSGALTYNHFVYTLQYEKENVICWGLDYTISSEFTKETIDKFAETFNHLFIVDFSLPIPLMEYAYKKFGNSFVWCDHHKPVIIASQKSKLCECEGCREINRSALLCVFKYLYDSFDDGWETYHDLIPKLFRILSAWDSFTYEQEGFELDYVRKVNYGITHLFKLDLFEVARTLQFNDNKDNEKLIERAYQVGKILVEDEAFRMKSIIKDKGDFNWTVGDDNRKAVAVFIQGASNSRMFESVIDKVDNAIVFKKTKNNDWVVSLYNPNEKDETFHCGNYCREKYKGGGHSGAAGFNLTQSQFIKVLKAKHI